MRIGSATDNIATRFVAALQAIDRPAILELGTLRWETEPTHHLEWAPPGSTYVMSDVTEGPDVDVVADAHDLSPFSDGAFDAVVCCSVWEHLARPWLAAVAVARVLKPGGLAYISTHQTFPLHGYPADFFRFSTEALDVLFTDAGLDPVETGYGYPVAIVPGRDVTRWNTAAPAWLNVTGVYSKPC